MIYIQDSCFCRFVPSEIFYVITARIDSVRAFVKAIVVLKLTNMSHSIDSLIDILSTIKMVWKIHNCINTIMKNQGTRLWGQISQA